jgi:predicted O-methyltransferase YrrM
MPNISWHRDLGPFVSGSTEPWAVSVLQALVRLRRSTSILELGTYQGLTTAALREVSSGFVTSVDLMKRWETLPVGIRFVESEALEFLRSCPASLFDFAFVDDDHTKGHVAMELDLLLGGIVAPGGLIVGHDVEGAFDLAPLFIERGGFVISLPQLHVAGSLGVIEVPKS